MKFLRKIGFCLLWMAVLIFIVLTNLWTSSYQINVSSSIPKGLYEKVDIDIENIWSIRTGNYVAFCTPVTPLFKEAHERGYFFGFGECPENMGVLIKIVKGEEGDKITINNDGVFVNGKLLNNSKPLFFDSKNRHIKPWIVENYKLKNKEFLLMGDNALSFDSRYYGPIKKEQIRKVVSPVFTWR